jgi:hypothetical protein
MSGQYAPNLGNDTYRWGGIADVRVQSLATGRSLGRSIVYMVSATFFFAYGFVLVVTELLDQGLTAGLPSLELGGLVIALGILFGHRAAVACWQFWRYAMTIEVVGQPKPVKIRPSRRRPAVEAKDRDIHARRSGASGAPCVGQVILTALVRWVTAIRSTTPSSGKGRLAADQEPGEAQDSVPPDESSHE